MNNRVRSPIWDKLQEKNQVLLDSWEIENDEIEALNFYIRNLFTLILPNEVPKELETTKVEFIKLLEDIEKFFKNDKKLIIKFIRFLKEKYDNKEYKYREVLTEALLKFNKKRKWQ